MIKLFCSKTPNDLKNLHPKDDWLVTTEESVAARFINKCLVDYVSLDIGMLNLLEVAEKQRGKKLIYIHLHNGQKFIKGFYNNEL